MYDFLNVHNKRLYRLGWPRPQLVNPWCIVWLLAMLGLANVAAAQDRLTELTEVKTSVVETPAELAAPEVESLRPKAPVVRTPGVSTGDWISAVMGLVLIVVLILMAAWFVKRFTGLAVGQNKQLNIVAALPLGPRERIALVQVGKQQVLVGITAQTITHLQSYDEPVIEPVDGRSSEFSKRLQSVLSGDHNLKDAINGNKEHA